MAGTTLEGTELHQRLAGEEGVAFNQSVHHWAKVFSIPYSRFYDACVVTGHANVATPEVLLLALVYMQHRTLPFAGLAEGFGPDATLGQLVEMEAAALEHAAANIKKSFIRKDKRLEKEEVAD